MNGTMTQSLYDDTADDARRHLNAYPGLKKHVSEVLTNYNFAKDMKIFAVAFE